MSRNEKKENDKLVVDVQTLRVAQQEMLRILKEIDRICEKYNLKYWLHGGTLLGAVRHKGFIPWDDDCDISMMREDFECFKKLISRELDEDFFFQDSETDPAYKMKLIKIRSNKIRIIEKHESEKEKYHQGVYVDIFVYDFYPENSEWVLPFLNSFLRKKRGRVHLPKGSLKRSLRNLSLLPHQLVFLGVRFFYRLIWKKFRAVESKKVGASMDHEDYHALFNAEDIFPVEKKMRFENDSFYVPNNVDKVLKHCFGDYMQLPPEEKRVWHARKIQIL